MNFIMVIEQTHLTKLGKLIMYKTQSVCLYNQVSNAMYPHCIPWAIKLREMGAQSQKQHDVLCRHTAGRQISINEVKLFDLVEQAEEKDEVVKQGLQLIIALEKTICALSFTEDLAKSVPVQEVLRVSKNFLGRLERWQSSFDKRFVNSRDKAIWIYCSMCGHYEQVRVGYNWTDDECLLCGGVHSMR